MVYEGVKTVGYAYIVYKGVNSCLFALLDLHDLEILYQSCTNYVLAVKGTAFKWNF